METNRFILGAIIHAVIIALAIVYAGERMSTPGESGGTVTQSGVKTTAAPVNQAPPPSLEGADLIEKFRTPGLEHRIYGDSSAPIKLISYFDVKCTFCRRFYSVAKRAVDESQGAVSWNLRHFPLDDQAPSANWAKVPECIAEQRGNKGFFAFFDKIYLDEAPLNDSSVSDLISSLDVDRPAYESCLNSEDVSERIKSDINEGRALGVQGTPTTVIYNTSNENAILKMGAMPIEQLSTWIEQVK